MWGVGKSEIKQSGKASWLEVGVEAFLNKG